MQKKYFSKFLDFQEPLQSLNALYGPKFKKCFPRALFVQDQQISFKKNIFFLKKNKKKEMNKPMLFPDLLPKMLPLNGGFR